MGVLGRRRVGVAEPDQKPIDASDELPLGVWAALGLPFLGFLIGGTTERLSLCVLQQGEILRIRKPVSCVVSLSSTVSGHSPILLFGFDSHCDSGFVLLCSLTVRSLLIDIGKSASSVSVSQSSISSDFHLLRWQQALVFELCLSRIHPGNKLKELLSNCF